MLNCRPTEGQLAEVLSRSRLRPVPGTQFYLLLPERPVRQPGELLRRLQLSAELWGEAYGYFDGERGIVVYIGGVRIRKVKVYCGLRGCWGYGLYDVAREPCGNPP